MGVRDRGREGGRETQGSVPGVAMHISMPVVVLLCIGMLEGGFDGSMEVRAVREGKEGARE